VTDRSLRSGFLRSAAETPSAIALHVRGHDISYAELERSARTWAGALLEATDGPPCRVGIFGARSEVSYAATLAALFLGATFVPLNPKFPAARTRDMLRLADVDALIVDANGRPKLEAVLAGLDRRPRVLEEDAGAAAPIQALPAVSPSEAAYLLFTSGSTGTPKGVPVSHGNVRHFIDAVTRRYGITGNDRFSQTFDQTFDLSMFDLFVAWESGARVCVPEPIDLVAPTAFIRRHQLTVWFSVPSIVALMRRKGLLTPGSLPTLRWSLFCGEALPRLSAQAWQHAAPHSIVENLYGPTELTIACLVHRWDAAASPALCVNDIVPIGRPFDGLDAVVTDGELCVSGPQTVAGYWRDPSRTAERFVRLPRTGGSASIYYRTGDRVRRLSGGEFVYLGRADDQIKVRGYRVELGEIEAVLRGDPRVANAVALGWPDVSGSAQGIVAFVCGREIDVAALTRAAEARLPDYMRPAEILVLDEFPLNASGKVDRRALGERLDARVRDAIVLDLQRQASEAYSTFVFDTAADADEFWRLLFDRGVAEFSPPYGRLAMDEGRVVGLIARLDQRELRNTRLRSAHELHRAGFFRTRPGVERRIQLASRALIPLQAGDFYLSRLAVAADARRRGVGSRLAAEFEAEAASRGCTRLALEVSADNQQAVRFYETRGFARLDLSAVADPDTGRRLEYVHMVKALA